jgi:protein-glutamine gamma-glutamyltransferase
MTFAQCFKASSYCLIGSGFIALAATGGLDWISTILFSAVFIGSWFLNTAGTRQRIPRRLLNILGLAYIPFCIIDYRLLSHSFLLAIIHLLLFTAAVKLLTLSKDRDYILLYLISLAELLGASTLTVNMVFIACFLVFLFSGISSLILFEMRRANTRMQDTAVVQPLVVPRQLRGTGLELFSSFPAGLLLAVIAGITILILVVAVPIFYLLPRVTLGRYQHPSGDTQFTSGFSERVELGQLGTIKQSDAVVMRVKTDSAPSGLPADLKWRGLSFDYYDGRAWMRTDHSRSTVPVQGWHYKLETSTQGTHWIHQTFFVEALSTNVIFATHKALAVSRDVGMLWRDRSENLFAARPLSKKLRYSVLSDPIRPDPNNISDLSPIPPEVVKIYTQLPPEDPRVAKLAKQVTDSVKDRFAKAQAIEAYLRTRYRYSLALRGTPNSPDPLSVFLFETRSGHCEYFASAMVIMLRQLGIPARLVNGFRMGEYNRIGDDWTVRQYNAHSWVEAYFPPYGWIEFDPTPADPERPKSAFSLILHDLADAMDLWWWEGVVNYDLSKQSQMVGNLRARLENIQRGFKALADTIQTSLRAAVRTIRSPVAISASARRWGLWLFPVLLVTLLLAIRGIRKRISRSIRGAFCRRSPKMAVASFYMEALALLGTAGLKRGQGQTPLEFAQSLEHHPAGATFLSLTRLYNRVRFGHPDVPFHPDEAQVLLEYLRTSLKN